MSINPAEVRFLIQHRSTIEPILTKRTLTKKTALADAEFFRKQFGHYGRAVMELGHARNSAAHKLPESWLMCHDSAQQATPMLVAAVRAARIAQVYPKAMVHDVTCSIGTEGAALLEAGLEYLGSDLDYSRVLMARENLSHVAGWHGLVVADAVASVSKASVIIADPARRAGGRRISRLADLLPPLPQLLQAHHSTALAVKCAPGMDFSDWPGLVSVVSVAGEVKEACLYSPELAQGRRREAVVLNGQTQRIIHDGMCDDVDVGPVGRYIIDPDGAIVRAGLVRHYGYEEGLWQLDPRIAYLTGPQLPKGASGFAVIETVPIKKLKAVLKAYDCGSVEILVRGVDIDPDALRKKLALKGSIPLAVVITRIDRTAVAIVCKAREVTVCE